MILKIRGELPTWGYTTLILAITTIVAASAMFAGIQPPDWLTYS